MPFARLRDEKWGRMASRWHHERNGVYFSVGNDADGNNETKFKIAAKDMAEMGRAVWLSGI